MNLTASALCQVALMICAAVCVFMAGTGDPRVDAVSIAEKEFRESLANGQLYIRGFVNQQTGLSEFPIFDQPESSSLLERFGVSRRLQTISDMPPTSTHAKKWNDEQRIYCTEFNKLVLEHLKSAEETEPNQALQTTSVARSGFGTVPVSDRQRRGV